MMLAQFQSLYPNGSITSELLQVFQGKFIVRVSLQVEGIIRATGMAGADTIEAAEDEARNRALMVLGVSKTSSETSITNTNISKSLPLPIDQLDQQISTTPLLEEPNNIDTHHIDQVLSPSLPEIPEIPDETLKTSPQKLEMVSTPEPKPQSLSEEVLSNSSSNVTPFTPRSYSPSEDTSSYSEVSKKRKKKEPVNLSDVIAQTDVQIERLGWTKEQGREHLKKTYGKLGRSLLSEEELIDFLNFLKSQPDPIAGF